jgi:hypothetical protein
MLTRGKSGWGDTYDPRSRRRYWGWCRGFFVIWFTHGYKKYRQGESYNTPQQRIEK